MQAASIGIDQSATHTGVIVLAEDGTLLLSATIEPALKGVHRLDYIRTRLATLLKPYRETKIGVREGYALGSTNRPFLLGEIGGIVQLALFDHCLRVEECAPKALKKFTASKGAAGKEDMKTAVRLRWGVHFDDDNLADAYALARVGLSLLDPKSTTRRDQLEVMATIAKGPTKKRRSTSFRPNPNVL